MIVFFRSASIAPGKNAGALKFANEIAAYLKDKYGLAMEVAIPIGGNPNRVGWSSRLESLAALEAAQAKLHGDTKYAELIAKGADNYIAGSVHDVMWRIL